MKKLPWTRMALGLGTLTLVAIAGFAMWPPSSVSNVTQTPSPMQMPLDRKPEYVSPTLMHLQSHRWNEVQSILAKSNQPEEVLTQILRFAQKNGQDPVSAKAVVDLLMEHIDRGVHSPREAVLATHAFGYLNLQSKEQKNLRDLYSKKIDKRLLKDLLPQAFLGTQPFPQDFGRDLLKRVRSKDLSEARESLFTISQIKDAKAMRSLEQNLLVDFWKLSAEMRPFVAKHLVTRAGPEMKADARFRKVTTFSKTQSGEVWAEVAAWSD